jgi:putative transcriptional regulator
MNTNRMKDEFVPNLQGHFLVAAPILSNSAFQRSVILILQDDHNGTFGVALNQIADVESANQFKSMSGVPNLKDASAFVGGDKGGPIFAIHRSRALADLEIPGGIFLSSQAEKLNELMGQIESPYRLVLGVVGWAKEEIRREIGQGLWLPMSASPDQIFGDPNSLWRECLRRHGRDLLTSVIGPVQFPPSSQHN